VKLLNYNVAATIASVLQTLTVRNESFQHSEPIAKKALFYKTSLLMSLFFQMSSKIMPCTSTLRYLLIPFL